MPELGRPIIEATVPVTCALNAAAVVLIALTFFPVPAYRRWLAARHERASVGPGTGRAGAGSPG